MNSFIKSMLALALLIISCGEKSREEFDILLLNATLVDIREGKVTSGQLVGIRNDTIRRVADMSQAHNFKSPTEIDADNKFVVPGLWDMHVHFRGGDSLTEENQALLPLFLAHGVTTVRDAGGDITPRVLEWRNAIRNGRQVGPDIFTSGPKFDGPDPYWEGSIALSSTADIGPALDSLEQLGVNYIKNYDGSLTAELYYELIRLSEQRGLRITGHMPLSADLLKAQELGLDGIEHLYYLIPATSSAGDSLRAMDQGYRMLPEMLAAFDSIKAREVFRKLGNRGFYATPTLHIGQVLTGLKENDHKEDRLLAHIGPGIQKTYKRRIQSALNASPQDEQFDNELEQWFGDMILPLHRAGVNLLAGSDCGPFNSFVYPGASLQEELKMMVVNGLSPAQALKTSIVNGPKFFGLEEYYGDIAEGKLGHLILLGKNPLEDLEHLGSLETVIKGSRVYTPGHLLAP
jgi:imidazolonepropionase-like amidohydrolase